MTTTQIQTLVVLGADGDLTRRLLLPGLASLLGSDWGDGRSIQLLGAGLSELSDKQWRGRVEDAFADGGHGGNGGHGGHGGGGSRTGRGRPHPTGGATPG